MARLKERLAALAKALQLNGPLLKRAQKRYLANRKRAYVAHNKQVVAQRIADEHRAYGDTRKAALFDKQARRHAHVAYQNHLRAQHFLGLVKTLQGRIHGLEADQDAIQHEIKRLSKVRIKGNHATGGSARGRFKAVCLASVANCSIGKRRNFYSMSGAWDIDREIEPGPAYGSRSDCSSTVTGWAKAAGLPDPNGANFTGGYTGTLVGEHNGWKEVSRSTMEKTGWGYVVYGSGVGHHTEAYVGPGDRTAGHGSPPVDFGVIDLFGDGDFRCYCYKP